MSKMGELKKEMKTIKILKENTRGNTVRIGNKEFSRLRPEPNDEDVFEGPEGYEDVRYIKGDAMEKYLGDYRMFKDGKEFEEFIKKNIEGEIGVNKLKTFADLMGLEFSGFCHPNGEFGNVGDDGFAWVSLSDGAGAYGFEFNSGYADVHKSNHKYAQPVVVYRDI